MFLREQSRPVANSTPGGVSHDHKLPVPLAPPIHHLQKAIGNRAVQRLFSSDFIQGQFHVSQTSDQKEKQVDRVADYVMTPGENVAGAEQTARADIEKAFTAGRDIVSAADRYSQDTTHRKQSSTHELIHRGQSSLVAVGHDLGQRDSLNPVGFGIGEMLYVPGRHVAHAHLGFSKPALLGISTVSLPRLQRNRCSPRPRGESARSRQPAGILGSWYSHAHRGRC